MSKGSLFWGNAKGKLGETVFYRAGGEQRNRTYVKNVKNPKTLAQMVNRLSMSNFSAVYRALAPIIKEGFPSRKTNQSGFNAFMQANKSVESAVIGNAAAANGYSVPVNMIIAKGALGLVTDLAYVAGTGFVSKVALPAATAGAITTAQQLADALDISGANALQLPANVKVTIVTAVYGDEGFRTSFRQLETANSLGANASLPAANGFGLAALEQDGKVYLGISVDSAEWASPEEIMAAIVISYTDGNGKLQVTTSRVWSADPEGEAVTQFLKSGVVWDSVLQAYGYNPDGYLATASQSVSAPSNGGGNGDGGDGNPVEPSITSLVIDGKSITAGATVALATGAKNVTISGANLADVTAAKILLGDQSYTMTISSKTAQSLSGTVTIAEQAAYTSVTVQLDNVEKFSATVTGSKIESGSGESNPL